MHLLSPDNRSEFIATPELVRFDYVSGGDGGEATLLIKTSSLMLKYIVQGVPMRFCCARMGDRLIYAVMVNDDESNPAIIWSMAEREGEIRALTALSRGELCQVFLFNELAINVACATRSLSFGDNLGGMVEGLVIGPANYELSRESASPVIERFYEYETESSDLISIEIPNDEPWKPIINHYVTSQGESSPIHIFETNEGFQQEQLAVWLTDSLLPLGAHLSPQIPRGSGTRELTDVLLNHRYGATLIESKSLTIFSRKLLPSREKLARDIEKHIEKALRQLKGGIRQLNQKTPVFSSSGERIHVESDIPPHAVVMIPDLKLVRKQGQYGREMMKNFINESGSFVHILDVSELLRIVQAAKIIASYGYARTPMMGFNYYLVERAKHCFNAGTLCIEVLLRIEEEAKPFYDE